MSRKIIKPALRKDSDGNHYKLALPSVGTTFSVQFVSKSSPGIKKKVPLTISPKEDIFYALFEEDDVDFQLIVDHTKSVDRDVCYTLELQGKQYSFVLKPGGRNILETMKSLGRKLHFIKQSGEDGQTLVAEAAMKHGISFAAAEELVSRIKFTVSYSHILSERIRLFAKTLTGKTVKLKLHPKNTAAELKLKIEEKEGIPVDQQRIIFNFKQIEDHVRLCDRHIQNKSTVHVIQRLRGGGGPIPASSVDTETDVSVGSAPGPEDGKKTPKLRVGERGVICLGNQSHQRFGPAYFFEDKTVRVAPFVLEMRMGSRYKLV